MTRQTLTEDGAKTVYAARPLQYRNRYFVILSMSVKLLS